METTKMSTKGQVVIPKRIREVVGADAETSFIVTTHEDAIILRKIDPVKVLKDLEIFRELRRKAPKYSDAEIARAIKRARRRTEDRP